MRCGYLKKNCADVVDQSKVTWGSVLGHVIAICSLVKAYNGRLSQWESAPSLFEYNYLPDYLIGQDVT